jgi:DNA processing protein
MTIDRGTEYQVEALLGPLNEVERKFAPAKLFVAGDRGVLEQGARVCIVGTREPTREGAARARKLAKILVENGVVVVSGLARGIDTAAHEAAMEFNGRTIAVIGTPLDQSYPKENQLLQSRIMEEQLCVSQFAPGYPTSPKNFPIRNRTMALIGDATVLIEAGEKSGTISQAWEALRLGRALFLTKALVDCRYAWTAELMRYGATVLANDTIDDLLSALPDRRIAWGADVFAL